MNTAISDVRQTVISYRIWHLLAMQDIRQRYRRSTLGPFWITLSTMISIIALSIVYTKIFKMPTEEYLPFLAIGLVFWTFISSLIVESCSVFITAEGIIKQVNLPFGIHVVRMVWRNIIVLGHNLVVAIVVMIYAKISLTLSVLLIFPALVLVAITGVAIGYLMGALCTRFRDVPQVVSSLIQVLFYVTPVIWKPQLLVGHEELLYFNPTYHFLEILRAPLLGQNASLLSWVVSFGMAIVTSLIAIIFISRYRQRIAYWL
jgi:ABC-type polysaccharide/polyol phosphate export permease